MSVQLLVIYPQPQDPSKFDRDYVEHLELGKKNLVGATGISTKRILGAPQGTPAFYQISLVDFPSMEALQECAATQGAQDTLAHAVQISTGGPPHFAISQDNA